MNITNNHAPMPEWLKCILYIAAGILGTFIAILMLVGPPVLAGTKSNAWYLLLWAIPAGGAIGFAVYIEL